MSLMSTRKRSSGIWASVWRNTVPMFFSPTFTYNAAMSLWIGTRASQEGGVVLTSPADAEPTAFGVRVCGSVR